MLANRQHPLARVPHASQRVLVLFVLHAFLRALSLRLALSLAPQFGGRNAERQRENVGGWG
eukprot:4340565-Pyramimonas_sp.AAC.1